MLMWPTGFMQCHQSDLGFINFVCCGSTFHLLDDSKDLFEIFQNIRTILKQRSKVEDQICNLAFKEILIAI